MVLYGYTSVIEGNIIILVSNVQYTEQGLIKRVIIEYVSWSCYICGRKSDLSDARRPSNDAGCDVGWSISSAAIASDSRTRVLLAPESAHTSFLGGGFNGAHERILVVVFSFCLTLDKGELKLIFLLGFGSGFFTGRGGT